MKMMKKKWVVLLVTMMMVLTMATPVSAAVSKSCKGSLKPGITYVTAGVYRRKFLKTATLTIKQKKGKVVYKKVNGKTVNISSYAKVRLIIREGGEKGKIVVNTIWNNGTFKYKCKANQKYTVQVSYYDNNLWDVLPGPLKFVKWKTYPTWSWT